MEGQVAPEGYFEVSKPQEYKQDLLKWEQWFASKSIKTCYIQEEHGFWILCREGIEALSEHRRWRRRKICQPKINQQ